MQRVCVLLTSVSDSKARSSLRLSLMRARLFFSTKGFRICNKITFTRSKRQEPKDTVIVLHLSVTGATSASLPPSCSPVVPFCPLSESRSQTHLRPYPFRCCWPEPMEPCWSDGLFCGFYHRCFLSSLSRRRRQLADGTGFRKKKKSTNSQMRRGALCLLCNPKRRAAGAEWLLFVFIGAY